MELKVDGVSFNRDWLESFSSETEFLAAMQDEGQAHIYAGENREEKLKTVWALLHPPLEILPVKEGSPEGVVFGEESVVASTSGEVKYSKRTKKVGNTPDIGLAGGINEG